MACLLFIGIAYQVFISPTATTFHWRIQTDRSGQITWIDSNGPAETDNVVLGTHVIAAYLVSGAQLPLSNADIATRLVVRLPDGSMLQLRAPARPYSQTGTAIALLILAIFFLLCGLIVWLRAQARDTALQMLALCTMLAILLVAYIGGPQGNVLSLRILPLGSSVYFPAVFAMLFLTFPRNWLHGRRRGNLSAALAVASVVLTVLYLVAVYKVPDLYTNLVRWLLYFGFLASIVTAVVSLSLGYGRGTDPRLRMQRRIIIVGTVASFAPLILFSILPDALTNAYVLRPEQSVMALVFLPLSFGYAILKYDLMQFDTVIRRAAVHSLFVIILLSLYLTVTYLAGTVLGRIFTSQDQLRGIAAIIPIALATLVAGLLIAPLRALAQTGVERLLFPEIYRYHRLVREGDLPTEGTDLAVLAELMNTTVRTLLPVSQANLFVRRDDNSYVLCPTPTQANSRTEEAPSLTTMPLHQSDWLTGALEKKQHGLDFEDLVQTPEANAEHIMALSGVHIALLMPLRQTGRITGFLAVGPRGDGAGFSGIDREVLSLVTERYALVIDHALLLNTLERQVAEISSLYQASVQLTSALGSEQQDLPQHIVELCTNITGIRFAQLDLTSVDTPLTVSHRAGGESGHGNPSAADMMSVVASMTLPDDVSEPTRTFTEGSKPSAHMPLQARGQMLGTLHLEWDAPHHFSGDEQRLLTMFANQAAVAIEHAQLYGQALHNAEREPLTGLYNHRMIAGFLQRELSRCRHDTIPLSILIMDINGFKLFNDTYGHLAGDQLLKRVAQVLETCCRQTDFAGRTGGDEFTVVLPRADYNRGLAIAERIEAMAADMAYDTADGRQIPLNLSIGVASFPQDGDAANALTTLADERMYAAKRSGTGIKGHARTEDEAPPSGGFGILEALVAAVDNKDSYTAKHSEQVARFALLLAAEMGASQETLRTLRIAGLLHDVGKIGVPDRVLRKPGRLTNEEQEIMQQHVQLSEMLLRTVMPSPDLVDAVRYHHERWDGRGYPYGLAGTKLPLTGRIMIIADAVSAMMMDRPYRKGLSWEVTCDELRRHAGSQFDPHLIEPFIVAMTTSGAGSSAA